MTVPGLLVSSTEPPALKTLGRSSMLPEQFGADFLLPLQGRMIGVQRKTVGDLIASVTDGRLAKEVAQLTRCDLSVLIVEGRPKWSTEGELLGQHDKAHRWTRNAHRSLLWSMRDRGIWVEHSDDPADTVAAVTNLHAWLTKDKHSSLDRRPGPVSVWGRADHGDWARHLLMGFDGLGPEIAGRIVEHFGGVPLTWKVTAEELAEVPGLGAKRIKKIMSALDHA